MTAGSRGYFECEDILFEEALTDGLFQVPLKASAMDDLVPLTVMVGAVLFCSGMQGVVLDGSRMLDPGLVLDGEPERSELLYQLIG